MKKNLEIIYSEIGNKPFTWKEIRHLNIDCSPQEIHHNGGLKVLGRNKNNFTIYQIPESFYILTQFKKKKMLYPEKTLF